METQSHWSGHSKASYQQAERYTACVLRASRQLPMGHGRRPLRPYLLLGPCVHLVQLGLIPERCSISNAEVVEDRTDLGNTRSELQSIPEITGKDGVERISCCASAVPFQDCCPAVKHLPYQNLVFNALAALGTSQTA